MSARSTDDDEPAEVRSSAFVRPVGVRSERSVTRALPASRAEECPHAGREHHQLLEVQARSDESPGQLIPRLELAGPKWPFERPLEEPLSDAAVDVARRGEPAPELDRAVEGEVDRRIGR